METQTTAIAKWPAHISNCQLFIYYWSDYFEQFITAMEMKKKVCHKKIDKITKKVVKTKKNQNDGNNKLVSIFFKFGIFLSIINQVIQSTL